MTLQDGAARVMPVASIALFSLPKAHANRLLQTENSSNKIGSGGASVCYPDLGA